MWYQISTHILQPADTHCCVQEISQEKVSCIKGCRRFLWKYGIWWPMVTRTNVLCHNAMFIACALASLVYGSERPCWSWLKSTAWWYFCWSGQVKSLIFAVFGGVFGCLWLGKKLGMSCKHLSTEKKPKAWIWCIYIYIILLIYYQQSTSSTYHVAKHILGFKFVEVYVWFVYQSQPPSNPPFKEVNIFDLFPSRSRFVANPSKVSTFDLSNLLKQKIGLFRVYRELYHSLL